MASRLLRSRFAACTAREEGAARPARRTCVAIGFGFALMLLPAQARAQDLGLSGPLPIRIVGFTNIDYQVTGDRDIEDGFRQGEISTLVVAPLGDKLAFFGEFSAHTHSGGHGGEGSPTFAVMRALLRYDVADFLKFSVGRHHPRIGYWPNAFHHGVWLETTVSTPLLFDRHEGPMPGHFLGLFAEGTILPHTVGLGYSAGFGNGRGRDPRLPGDEGDVNRERAVTGTLYLRPPQLFGLQIGASVYVDRASPSPTFEWDERVLSAHLAWEKESPEVLAEYVHMEHERAGTGTSAGSSHGFYGQLAYRLPGALSPLKPYVRYERLDVGDDDMFLETFRLDYVMRIAGVRYDFAPFAALKGEFRSQRLEKTGRSNSFLMQASLTFGSGADVGGVATAAAGAPGAASQEGR